MKNFLRAIMTAWSWIIIFAIPWFLIGYGFYWVQNVHWPSYH